MNCIDIIIYGHGFYNNYETDITIARQTKYINYLYASGRYQITSYRLYIKIQ